jgi:hypothetical protein
MIKTPPHPVLIIYGWLGYFMIAGQDAQYFAHGVLRILTDFAAEHTPRPLLAKIPSPVFGQLRRDCGCSCARGVAEPALRNR